MLNSDGLILPELVEGQRSARARFAVLLAARKAKAAAFVALIVEEDHARRSLTRQCLSFNDAGMLAFAVGNDHLQFAVFLDDVDSFYIDLGEFRPLIGLSECRDREDPEQQGHYDAVQFEIAKFFFQLAHLYLRRSRGTDLSPNPWLNTYRRLSSLRRSSQVGDWRGLPQTGQSTVRRRRFTQLVKA